MLASILIAFGVISLAVFREPQLERRDKEKDISALPVSPKPFEPMAFASADGLLSIDFFSDREAHFKVANAETTIPWSYAGTFLGRWQPGANSCTLDQGRLRLPNGIVLYASSQPEIATASSMHMFANVAQEMFAAKQEYPDDLSAIPRSAFATIKQNELSIVYAGRDKTWNPDSPDSEPVCKQALENGQQIGAESPPQSGIIRGYYLLNGTADTGIKARAFFIRGTDRDGKWLNGSSPGKVFVIALKFGKPPTSGNAASANENTKKIKAITLRN